MPVEPPFGRFVLIAAPLSGKRILVVEDDPSLAAALARGLGDLGATVVGPAPTPFYALSLMGRRPLDAAVLDIHLYRTDVFEVAHALIARQVPIIFASVLPDEVLPQPYRHCPVLQKPIDPRAVEAIMTEPPAPPENRSLRDETGKRDALGDRLMRAVVRSLRLPN